MNTTENYEKSKFLPGLPGSSYGELYKRLGKGGYASVYSTKKNGKLTNYAIKVYGNDVKVNRDNKVIGPKSDTYIFQTMREISLLIRCKHPNIVNIVDYYFADRYRLSNILHLVMEKATTSLRGLLREDNLNLDSKNDISLQIIKGLTYLHSRDILHRDIKPDNILLDKVGIDKYIAKISDFGLSRSLGCAFSDELTNMVYTLMYRAPEVLLLEDYNLSKYYFPADIWALGCTLYELYEGRMLFEVEYKKSGKDEMIFVNTNDAFNFTFKGEEMGFAMVSAQMRLLGRPANTFYEELFGVSVWNQEVASNVKIDPEIYNYWTNDIKPETNLLFKSDGLGSKLIKACLFMQSKQRSTAFELLSMFRTTRGDLVNYKERKCSDSIELRQSYPYSPTKVSISNRNEQILNTFQLLRKNNIHMVNYRSINLSMYLYDASFDKCGSLDTEFYLACLLIATKYSEGSRGTDIETEVINTYKNKDKLNKYYKQILDAISYDLVQGMAIDFLEDYYSNLRKSNPKDIAYINMLSGICSILITAYYLTPNRDRIYPQKICKGVINMFNVYNNDISISKLSKKGLSYLKEVYYDLKQLPEATANDLGRLFGFSDGVYIIIKFIGIQLTRLYD